MDFGLLVSVAAEGSMPQGMIELSILRWSQFRLQRVKSFCREILLWVWDILWSVKSFGFLSGHCETNCEFLYLHLCAVTHVHRPTMVESLPKLVWDLQSWALLWKPYGGCKMISILTSSGEKSYFTGVPKPGVLQNARPFPLLQIDLYLREEARLSHTTASKMNTPKVKISSVHSANFSLGGLLD